MLKSKPLIAGLVSAMLGLAMLVVYMRRFEEEASGGAPVLILAAGTDIPLGASITPEMLSVRPIPSAYLESRNILEGDRDRVIAARTVSGVRNGEALLWSDLATSSDTSRDLSSLVQVGLRAITLQADSTGTFDGLVRPGDRVDILFTTDEPRANAGPERTTRTLLQSMLVLASGQDTGSVTSARQTQFHNVTLSATVEQAQLIAFASSRGRLQLSLRNPDDIPILGNLGATTVQDIYQEEVLQKIQKRRRRQAPAVPNAVPRPGVRVE